jgi:NFU1 iron-sulfur cluster scaffold homolog, mitochondrial
MEASLTAASASAAPPPVRFRITTVNPILHPRRLQFGPLKIRTSCSRAFQAAASASTPPVPGGGLYSAATYDLTAENVDRVLDDVRPYLIADGGDVTVASVEDGVISLKLEGELNLFPHVVSCTIRWSDIYLKVVVIGVFGRCII